MNIFKSKKQYIEKLERELEQEKKRNRDLSYELAQAKTLHGILEKLADKVVENSILVGDYCGGEWKDDDSIAQYVDDILGGKKVIKQEATKCLVVDSAGEVTTGLTAQSPDKGFSYKLVRKD